ncbi:MAG TPA: hypothetical protein VFX59_01410 [Polyangiales bacterium]|nr:hypothetical protein [Polyangiales bacterium]
MSMFDDYMMRMVKQLTEAIASIVRKLRGGSLEDADQEIAAAYDALLEHNLSFLELVDTDTLAHLLGSNEKVQLLAKLSWLEAELAQARGDTTRESQLRTRARKLLAIAVREDPSAANALRDL